MVRAFLTAKTTRAPRPRILHNDIKSMKQARPMKPAQPMKPAKQPTPRPVSKPILSIVIPVHESASRLPATIAALYRWPAVREVLVVANGVPHQTLVLLRKTQARILYYAQPLGHDVGRAIGAMHATAPYILFLDADIPFTIAELRPFLQAMRTGSDIALNSYPLTTTNRYDHSTAVVKRALNLALDRADLGASSMTTVPHAIRRSALQRVSVEYLAIPPVFQAHAVLAGLRVDVAAYVQVGQRNRLRKAGSYPYSVHDLILGDHIEAIHHLLQEQGPRGAFPDTIRRRHLVLHPHRPVTDELINTNQMTAVLPASNESATIESALLALREANVHQVLVVDNGSTDGTADIARRHGANIETYKEQLGHDVGRTLGAIRATDNTSSVLFIDADFSLPPQGLRPFVEALENGEVDMALNDLTVGLTLHQQRDPVSTMKRFLNLALHRADLGICSPTAVPNALSHRALQTLDRIALSVPPVSLVQAILAGLTVRPVTYVDVVRPNRYRRHFHGHMTQKSKRHLTPAPVTRLIIGDHLEALQVLIDELGPRAGYPQPRHLQVLTTVQRNLQQLK